MARVACSIEEVRLTNDNGYEVAGVCATCSECGHSTESFGVGEPSINRCLALMREECPEKGKDEKPNFYVEE